MPNSPTSSSRHEPACTVLDGRDPAADVLTADALQLVADVHRAHGAAREELLRRRDERRAATAGRGAAAAARRHGRHPRR